MTSLEICGTGLKAIRGLQLAWARAASAEPTLPANAENAILASESAVPTHVEVASTPQNLGEAVKSADSDVVPLVPEDSRTHGCSTHVESDDPNRHGRFDGEVHVSHGSESDDKCFSDARSEFPHPSGSEFEADFRVHRQRWETMMNIPDSLIDYDRCLRDIQGSAVSAEAFDSSLVERAEVVHAEIASTAQNLGEAVQSADSDFAPLIPEDSGTNGCSMHVASGDADRHWGFDVEVLDSLGSESDDELSSSNSSEIEPDIDFLCVRQEVIMNLPEPSEFLGPLVYHRYLQDFQTSSVSAETRRLLDSSLAQRSEVGPLRDSGDFSSSNDSESEPDIDFPCVRREAMANLPEPWEFLSLSDYYRYVCDIQVSAVLPETRSLMDSSLAQRSEVGRLRLESDIDVRVAPTRDHRMNLPHPLEYLTKRDVAKWRRKVESVHKQKKDSNDPTRCHSMTLAACPSSSARSSWQ